MKEKVLSVEQMQELINMGIDTSKASMCWGKWNDVKEYSLFAKSKIDRESFIQNLIELNCVDEEDEQDYAHDTIPAFILQDILEILPVRYGISRILDEDKLSEEVDTYELLLQDRYLSGFKELKSFYGNNLLEIAFEALKWCKENNYI